MTTNLELLAHRGLWNQAEEKNSLGALTDALDAGFGLETDVRPYGDKLLISHDAPCGNELEFEQLLTYYAEKSCTSTLAINIKADGLATTILHLLNKYQVEEYFCFDMSIPDHLSYLREGLKTYFRLSEFETATPLLEQCDGIWLDGFHSDWYANSEQFAAVLRKTNKLCVVSSELHGRQHDALWGLLQGLEFTGNQRVMLCTDFPQAYCEIPCA